MAEWVLAIDYGTTCSSGAVGRGNADAALVEVEGSTRFPSLVLLDADGSLRTGKTAVSRLQPAPERGERTPKRHLGRVDVFPIGRGLPVVEAVAAVLSRILAEARRRNNNTAPAVVMLTHPVDWEQPRLDVLISAAKHAGIDAPLLVPEPEAAAYYLAEKRSVPPGGLIGVFDLGGGTLDTAVLRHDPDGYVPAGRPGGDAHIGGENIDELLLDHLLSVIRRRDPDLATRLTAPDSTNERIEAFDLREQAKQAKEALSTTTTAEVNVRAWEESIPVTRATLEKLIAGVLAEAADCMADTLAQANVEAKDLNALYLTGDASRTPAVSAVLQARLGIQPVTWGDSPKDAVALGAIAWYRHQRRAAERADEEHSTTSSSSPKAARDRFAGLTADMIRGATGRQQADEEHNTTSSSSTETTRERFAGLTADTIRGAAQRARPATGDRPAAKAGAEERRNQNVAAMAAHPLFGPIEPDVWSEICADLRPDETFLDLTRCDGQSVGMSTFTKCITLVVTDEQVRWYLWKFFGANKVWRIGYVGIADVSAAGFQLTLNAPTIGGTFAFGCPTVETASALAALIRRHIP